jgi:hypothetical protein
MEETITFHINSEDKNRLQKMAKDCRMSLSSFCRFYLLDRKLNFGEMEHGPVVRKTDFS